MTQYSYSNEIIQDRFPWRTFAVTLDISSLIGGTMTFDNTYVATVEMYHYTYTTDGNNATQTDGANNQGAGVVVSSAAIFPTELS